MPPAPAVRPGRSGEAKNDPERLPRCRDEIARAAVKDHLSPAFTANGVRPCLGIWPRPGRPAARRLYGLTARRSDARPPGRPAAREMVFDAYVGLFSKSDVLALVGGRFFLRGIGCIGAVGELEKDGETIYATVQGAELYQVELYIGGERLRGRCDCPWAREAEVAGGARGAGSEGGNFCKHCVAVALVYAYETERGQALPRQLDVRSYLELLDHDDLVDVLAQAAEDDRKLRHLLHRRVAARRPGQVQFRYPRG